MRTVPVRRAVSIGAVIAAVTGAAVWNWSRAQPSDAPTSPNIVVILVDTLRADYLGLYGHEPETAPFLAHIARKAAVFDHAYSTSTWTAPATASVFTSLYPHQHGITQGFYAHKELLFAASQHGGSVMPLNAMSGELTTLTELLRERGYATFGIVANRNIDEELGFRQGFDRFFQKNDNDAADMYQVVREWQQDMETASPYFLYLHLMDPHMPYVARPLHIERYRALFPDDEPRAQYLSEIRHTDAWIERIFNLLGLGDNTLVVFLTDHGEEFNDHGHFQHGPWLFDELQRAMMMFYGPDVGVKPGRLQMNTSLIDVLPTLAAFTNAAAPDYAEGSSLWPLISGVGDAAPAEEWDARVLLGHRAISHPPYLASWDAIQGPWKYLEQVNWQPKLFNRDVDPAEQQDVIAEHPEIAARLAAKIAAARGDAAPFEPPVAEIPIDQELKQQLESLGYVESP